MRNVTYRRAATGFSKFNRNYFMPLTPSTNVQVISGMGTFSFPMIDGETVVPVQATDDTLEYMCSRIFRAARLAAILPRIARGLRHSDMGPARL
jgi:hypothetical protein